MILSLVFATACYAPVPKPKPGPVSWAGDYLSIKEQKTVTLSMGQGWVVKSHDRFGAIVECNRDVAFISPKKKGKKPLPLFKNNLSFLGDVLVTALADKTICVFTQYTYGVDGAEHESIEYRIQKVLDVIHN